MIRRSAQLIVGLTLLVALGQLKAQAAAAPAGGILSGVKTVHVEATVVPEGAKIKESSGPNLVQDSLRNAFRSAGFELADDSPIHAHIVLKEFSSGSTAKRVMVGFGAGRSTVDCNLVIQDASGKELSNARIRVRGNLVWSPYQGNNTQRRQAVSSLDQRLLEEIEKLK